MKGNKTFGVSVKDVTASASGTTVAAYSSVDIDTGVAPEASAKAYVGRYGGNPKAVITNIWTSGGTIHLTSFNPTNAAISLGYVTVVEFY